MNYIVWFENGGYCLMTSDELNSWTDNLSNEKIEKFYLAD